MNKTKKEKSGLITQQQKEKRNKLFSDKLKIVTHPQACAAHVSSCWLDPPVNDEDEKLLPIVSAVIRIRSTITWASF
jgi:hypothetical protein